jgi:hypothetical protein
MVRIAVPTNQVLAGTGDAQKIQNRHRRHCRQWLTLTMTGFPMVKIAAPTKQVLARTVGAPQPQ